MTRSINVSNQVLATLICTSMLALTGCGSFTGSSSSSSDKPATGCTSNCGSNGGNNSNGTAPGSEWGDLSMNGKIGQGGPFSGVQVISIDKTTKELVLGLPMPANPYLDGATIDFPIPELPGAHVALEPIATGGSTLVLRVPLKDLIKGVDLGDPQKLPNGDPLPAVPSGSLPEVAVQLTNLGKDIKATIYAGVNQLGVFVNTPFNPYIRMTLPIRNEDGTKTWGYFSSIPAKLNNDGGFFISVHIPDDIARIIDDNL